MSVPPEVLFDRFFRSNQLSVADRARYRGKQNLDAFEPQVRSFLSGVQVMLNEALRNEKKNVPDHVEHPPFHFDYFDSDIPNAMAFRFESFSFIGITMALVERLGEICLRLSRSEDVTRALGIALRAETADQIQALVWGTQLAFVVTHEYTHHVHGHLIRSEPTSGFVSEILDGDGNGSLATQAREVDADGYATYHVLADLIDGGRRQQAVDLIGLREQPTGVQDEALFASFVIAVGAFLFVRPPSTVDNARIYELIHPPQAARMNFIMHNAVAWCRQNRRHLESYMTKEKFQTLMLAAATATWGMNGGTDWSVQTAFLLSSDGAGYIRQLDEQVKAHVRSL